MSIFKKILPETRRIFARLTALLAVLVSLTACITPPPQVNLPQTTQPATGRQTRELKEPLPYPEQSQLSKLVVTVDYEPVQPARTGRIALAFTILNGGDANVLIRNPLDNRPITTISRGEDLFTLPIVDHRFNNGHHGKEDQHEHVLPFRLVEFSLNGRVLTKPEAEVYEINLPPQGRLLMAVAIDKVVRENSKKAIKLSAGEYSIGVSMLLVDGARATMVFRRVPPKGVIVRLE